MTFFLLHIFLTTKLLILSCVMNQTQEFPLQPPVQAHTHFSFSQDDDDVVDEETLCRSTVVRFLLYTVIHIKCYQPLINLIYLTIIIILYLSDLFISLAGGPICMKLHFSARTAVIWPGQPLATPEALKILAQRPSQQTSLRVFQAARGHQRSFEQQENKVFFHSSNGWL